MTNFEYSNILPEINLTIKAQLRREGEFRVFNKKNNNDDTCSDDDFNLNFKCFSLPVRVSGCD